MTRSGRNIAYYDLLEKNYSQVKNSDTEVVVRYTPTGYDGGMDWTGLRFINEVEALKSILTVEKEGFDGVSIACFFDPALKPARQLLNIPVTGLAEAAMHFACLMGKKFAIITANALHVAAMEEEIARYHMESQAIKRNPVRALPTSDKGYAPERIHDYIGGDYTPVIDSLNQVAHGCIEDGADVLMVGCGLISPILTQAGVTEIDGAIIIDPLLASLKLTEALVSLHQAGLPVVSRKSYYSAVSSKQIEEALAVLGR
jgi:allantoin racemase